VRRRCPRCWTPSLRWQTTKWRVFAGLALRRRPSGRVRSCGSAVGSEDDRCFARVAGVVQRVGVAAANQGHARLPNAVAFVSARLPWGTRRAPVWVSQAATQNAKPRRLSLDPGPSRCEDRGDLTSRSHPQPERGTARISVASTRCCRGTPFANAHLPPHRPDRADGMGMPGTRSIEAE